MSKPERESLGSRLGFLFLAAGCAIGLGNVWRFPFITGQYGGAAFVLFYLLFLVFLALPILVMEFSVGRASRLNIGGAFKKLCPQRPGWQIFGYLGICGNYLLMMFYTTVCGWMLAYCWYIAGGQLSGLSPEAVGAFFGGSLESPYVQVAWMVVSVILGYWVCSLGLRNGVERITKAMMSGLFAIIIVLVVRSVTLPGAWEGIKFYLMPDFGKLMDQGLGKSLYAALGQAFFTMSIGIGSMSIFGSYLNKERTLTGESVNIMILDTFVAIMSGLVIFPACFAFGVNPDAGPGLIFVTLPNIFNHMPLGQLWGVLFFVFMSFAALSTVIAVFENIVSFGIDVLGLNRRSSVLINAAITIVLSLPCSLGFNALKNITPMGPGTNILDLEDFILSNNLLPLGALVFLLFCTMRYGWGWDNFIAEADTGNGLKFPKFLKTYFQYVVPVIMVAIFIQGYYGVFFK